MDRQSNRDPDMSVMDIMDNWPETITVFIRYKMLCIGCSVAPFHTVKEACAEHSVDEVMIRAELDSALSVNGYVPLSNTN